MALDTAPTWLRGGLNADIDIITQFTENQLRIPKRYLIENTDGTFIRTLEGSSIATTTVQKEVAGNDGWVGVSGPGVTAGTTIVTP